MRDEKIEKYWFRRNDRKCPEDGKKAHLPGILIEYQVNRL